MNDDSKFNQSCSPGLRGGEEARSLRHELEEGVECGRDLPALRLPDRGREGRQRRQQGRRDPARVQPLLLRDGRPGQEGAVSATAIRRLAGQQRNDLAISIDHLRDYLKDPQKNGR